MPRICEECNQEYFRWCKPYNLTHFKNDFDKWTSKNEKTYKFTHDAQLNADDYDKAIEWILYDRFQDIKHIAKGGFGTIYYAEWIDGNFMAIYLRTMTDYSSIRFYGITKDPENHNI
ncbi:hypothetical protein Glove_276g71 [Diversispora epigaea]|uniref:Protein kinase domain-containing protein n=1 Tax=Diversispora epigaea TaxID=1348612 RepID=A0A397I482_9GLOM|nr:hypothetical protein Glove_276g71 [Diversispora epigaea]